MGMFDDLLPDQVLAEVDTPLTYKASKHHLEGLDSDTRDRFINLSKAYYDMFQEPLVMRSGHRSTKRQAELYAADPNSGYVAPPGNSTHEKGLAIDLDKKQVAKMPEGMIEQFFNRPLMGQTASRIVEKWHVEHPDARQDPIFNTRGGQTGGGGGILVDIGNALGPKSAEAAEGPPAKGGSMFSHLLPEGKAKSGGGGGSMFSHLLPENKVRPAKGLTGQFVAGVHTGLGESAGKAMGAASTAVGAAHGYFPEPDVDKEQIKMATPAYEPPTGFGESLARGAGGMAGGLPEFLAMSLPLGGTSGGLLAGLGVPSLAARVAGNMAPMALTAATSPDATGRGIGASAGMGATIPFIQALPWKLRSLVGAAVGAAGTALGNPEASTADMAQQGTLMALLSTLMPRSKAFMKPNKGAPAPTPETTDFPMYRPKVTYGPDGKPVVEPPVSGKRAMGYGEAASRLAEVDRIMKERASERLMDPTQPPAKPPLRGTPEGIDFTKEPPIPVIEPSIIQKPGSDPNARPGQQVIYSDRGKAMEYGEPTPKAAVQNFELTDLDRRIAMKYGAPSEPALIPQPTELAPQPPGVPATRPEPGVPVPVTKAGAPGEPPVAPKGTPPVVPPAAPTTPEAPAAALTKQQLYQMATKAKTFEEFNKAVGTGTPPSGVPLQEFYDTIKGVKKTAAQTASEATPDLKGLAPINNVTMSDFVKGIISKDWNYLSGELTTASKRFNTDTVMHNFNSLTLRGEVESTLKSVKPNIDANPKEFRAAVTKLMKEYEDKVWNPHRKGGMGSEGELPTVVDYGELRGSPEPHPENPAIISRWSEPDTNLEYQHILVRDPDVPTGFRVIEQDIFKGRIQNQRAIATASSPAELAHTLASIESPRWRQGEKFGEGYKALEGGPTKMYSGGPDTSAIFEKVVNAVKPIMQDIGNRLVGADVSDFGKLVKYVDMYGVLKPFRLPYWVAKKFPTFAGVMDTSLERIDSYYRNKNNFLADARPFLVDLPQERLALVEQLLIKGDQIGASRTGVPAEQLKEQLVAHREAVKAAGEDVYGAYMAVRTVLDNIWDATEAAHIAAGVKPGDIAALRAEMGFQPEYFPHSWQDGKFYVVAKDAQGNTIDRATAKSQREGNAIYKDMVEKYGKDNVDAGRNTKAVPEEAFFGLNPESAARVADAAIERLRSKGLISEIDTQAVHGSISDSFKARGFGSHFIDRQNVQGFQTSNLREVLVNYANSAAGYISKMEAAPRYFEHLHGIDSTKTPNLYSYGRNYIKDVLANTSKFDQAMGVVRGAMFHKYIGAVPKTAWINLSQNFTAFAPWMAKEGMAMPELKVSMAIKDVLSDWGSFRGLHKGQEVQFKGLTPQESKGLVDLFKNGGLNDWQTQELMGPLYGRGWGILSKALDASRFMFGTAEQLNRTAAGLSAYRFYANKFKDMGPEQAHAAAVAKAGEAILSTHYLMGKYNLPESARGNMKVLRSTGYQFKGFTHNYMEMMANIVSENPKAALRGIVNLSLLAGPLAIPVVNEAMALYRYITGTDPVEDGFKDKDDPAYIFTKYGMPGFLETDVAQSMSPNIVMGDTPGEIVTNLVAGPLGSMVLNEIPQAADLYRRDFGARSLEPIMPTALRNAMRAIRESESGVITKRGQEVFDPGTGEQLKLTGREAAQQVAGFRPLGPSKQATERDNVVRRQESRQVHQDILATRFTNALKREDEATMEKVLAEVEQYNEWATERGEPPIDLNALVTARMKPKVPAKSWQPYIMQNRGE